MLNRDFRFVVAAFVVLCGWNGWCAQFFPKCQVSGKITRGLASKLSVRLRSVDPSPLALYDGYSTATAPDGSFHFDDVDPGSYILLVEGPGFIPSYYGAPGPSLSGTLITLKPGQHRRGIALTPIPKHVVCGKVTDENGKPLAKVEIYAFAHRKGTNWLTIDDAEAMWTKTDNDGNYRLPSLGAGEYFVQAGMYTWFSLSASLTQPEAESLANAEPVNIGPAARTDCQENIRVGQRLGYFGWHIRGTIADDSSLTGKDLVLSLLEVSRTGASRVYPTGEVFNPGRSFDLWGVPGGRYRLILANGRFPQGRSTPPPEFHVLSSQDITVFGADVNGLTLEPNRLASLAGQVKLEGVTPTAACPTQERLHISIQKEDDGQYQQVELGADGTFAFQHVDPGSYVVRFYPFLRGSVYVKSMLLDELPVDRRQVFISPGSSSKLSVVLSADPNNAYGHVAPSDTIERFEEASTHPKATVSGKVTNVFGNELSVRLWSVRFSSDASYEYSTKPAADGNFRFDGVDPGTYLLMTQESGIIFMYGASGPGLEGKALTLKSGQRRDGLSLAAPPEKREICGKVTDENGKPVPNVGVDVWGYPLEPTKPMGNRSITDSSGNYSVRDLTPGRYYAYAFFDYPGPETSETKSTYFPAATSFDDARPIDLGASRDRSCPYDIRLRTSPTFAVRGKVAEPIPNSLGDRFYVDFSEVNKVGEGRRLPLLNGPVKPGEPFYFRLHPGRYTLRLTSYYGNGREIFSGPCCPVTHVLATQEITIRDADLNDLVLNLTPLASLSGEVRFENISLQWKQTRVDPPETVSISSHDDQQHQFLDLGQNAKIDSEGNFSFQHLDVGTYRVELGLRGPLYVKSMVMDGQAVDGANIKLSSAQSSKLTIVVSGDGGEVDAQVLPSEPPAEQYRDTTCRRGVNPRPTVFLIPDRPTPDGASVLMGWLTNEGFVQKTGVPPGKYRAVAGENFHLFGGRASSWRDPKFLQALAALGQAVEVEASQEVKVALPSSTAEIQNLMAAFGEPINMSDCVGGCSISEFQTNRSSDLHKP